MEALLRKSLLGKDVNEVHFHVFSRRSNSRVLDPRVLNADATLLESSSKYFADLFSSAVIPSDTAVMNVKTPGMILDGIDQSEYGYESDSDLEDDTDTVASPTQRQATAGSDSNDGDSGTCAPNTASSEKDYEFLPQRVSNTIGLLPEGLPSIQPNTMGLGGGRHVFVKDAAFQTWYCLLHFLYTDVAEFSPLKSSGGSKIFSCNTSERPMCSAKSMYRLATKLNIAELRDQAFASIRNNINENNLLQELASSFTAKFPAVLEMELNLLLEKIASAPIVEGLPKLMARISQKELSHGADIMAGFYGRILKKHYTQLHGSATVNASCSRTCRKHCKRC
ncbi:hypothetical protein PISMIDRAFT_685161 [Pisolithus microcarpus 441]|uniref:BTB domain-containing protein n=1 Tax=Pisolithus microcarpus 441 TaxID=765257 RepID=A0A0C9YU55_9AGAM|nr:hypothetical protein PISMIDRAFT_685161 [Pisolithus microcarpus 441]